MRSLLVLAALAFALALVGCGGGGESLTLDEQATVASFNADVALTAGGSTNYYGELLEEIDPVIALAREKPDAEHEGATMRQVLSDAASDLEQPEPELAAELDRAVATLD